MQNQRLQHSFSSFSKFAEGKKKTSRQLRTVLFFVLPDQNTFHALKSIFFKNKKKFNKRHIISISFLKSFGLSFMFFLLKLFFFNHTFLLSLWESDLRISPWLEKQIAQYRWEKKRSGLHTITYRSVSTGTVQWDWQRVFNVHQNGENSFRLMHQNGRNSLRSMHQTGDSTMSYCCTVMAFQYFSDRCTIKVSACVQL